MVVQVTAFFQNINLNTHSIESDSSKRIWRFWPEELQMK